VCTASWKAHTGIVLSSIIVPTTSSSSFSSPDGTFNASDDGKETGVVSASGPRRMSDAGSVKIWSLITGASDDHIKVCLFCFCLGREISTQLFFLGGGGPSYGLWKDHMMKLILLSQQRHPGRVANINIVRSRMVGKHFHSLSLFYLSLIFVCCNSCYEDSMVHALTEFVAIPSVTNSQAHRESCRRAAIWLKQSFLQLGAEAILVSDLFFLFPSKRLECWLPSLHTPALGD
jgi:hypothetical protein